MPSFRIKLSAGARLASGVVFALAIAFGVSAVVAQSSPPVPPEIVPNPPSREQPSESRPERPACDAMCVRRNADPAAQACVSLIEAKAPADYDWLSRPFGGMFTQAEQPGADGIVRYRGDSIRVLAQNQWLRHAYECAWDAAAGKIVAVQLRPGRLVPPEAIAQLMGSPLAGQPATAAPTKTPAEAQQIIRDALQRAVAAQAPAAKPKPRWGEPGPISIQQARLHSTQVDSLVSISQAARSVPRSDRRRTRDRSGQID